MYIGDLISIYDILYATTSYTYNIEDPIAYRTICKWQIYI